MIIKKNIDKQFYYDNHIIGDVVDNWILIRYRDFIWIANFLNNFYKIFIKIFVKNIILNNFFIL